MKNFLAVFLSTLSIIYSNTIIAQNKTDIYGTVKGIVRDTTHNYVLKSATVSVYKASNKDSALIVYQITNAYGEFNFSGLPIGIPLKLQISNVGYYPLDKFFTIHNDTKSINLKTLVLSEKSTFLKEVTVTVPPITMNGDTLEFNATAFKLDTNAVVEDLLRKIPNIIVWGDGKISVNGRDVKSLLVNGKEFFGGDFKIATQNIAKNAIDKIQVYKKIESQNDILDSTVEMNVKLKKGKDVGYFGKIGVGYGSDKRYEGDASINAFTPKMQFTLVGALNNINKLTNNASTLSNNSTFKGVGTNIEYRPDFSMSGINVSKALGSSFIYNFIEKPTYTDKSRLSINYFMQDKNNDYSSSSETITTIKSAVKILDENVNKRIANDINQKIDSKFEWIKNNHSLIINQALTTNVNESNNETFRNFLNEQNILTSTNNSINKTNETARVFDFSINYQMSESWKKFSRKFKGLNASYILNFDDANNERINQTEFKSFTDQSSNRKFNRKYQTQSNSIYQQFNFEITKLKEFLFGEMNFANLDFSLSNNLSLNNKNNNNLVEDFNGLNSIYEQNNYLTSRLQTTILEEAPSFILLKSFSDNLSNRYTRNWSISLVAKQKFIYQYNVSDKAFQNIDRKYIRFVPEASINYNNNQYGEYYRTYSINYTTSVKIPGLQQLVPLIDSANVYYIQNGNLSLKEMVIRGFSFRFNHEDQTAYNTMNYGFNMGAGIIENNIIDSISIGNDNRKTVYYTNANGYKYFSFDGNIRKSIKLKSSQLQISLNNIINISSNPGYLNGVFNFSKILSTNSVLKLNYTYNDFIAIEATQAYTTYTSKQKAFKTQYSGANMASTFSSSYSLTKKLTISSNITFNSSKSANINTINFAIWNASAMYRLLKGNNLEFKFSALDLLHQNNSIINYGSLNSFTTGTQNVLQNYFMTTISYYPRQFGKKLRKK